MEDVCRTDDTSYMGLHSKRKGSSGERECASEVTRHLRIAARRSVQYCGSAGDADLALAAPICIEVKRYAKIAAIRFLNQVEQDASATGDLPLVVMREDGDKRWVVMVRLDDVQRLVTLVDAANRHEINKALL